MPRDDMDWLARCRVCGCTELEACETEAGPCQWAAEGLCSACVESGEQLVIDLAALADWLAEQQARAWQWLEATREELGLPYTQIAAHVPGLCVRRLEALLMPEVKSGPPPSWKILKQIAEAIHKLKPEVEQ